MAVDLVFERGEGFVQVGFFLERVAEVAFEFFVVGYAAGGVGWGDVFGHFFFVLFFFLGFLFFGLGLWWFGLEVGVEWGSWGSTRWLP